MDFHPNEEILYPFPETIIIQKRISALETANSVYSRGAVDRRLVIWVDASVEPIPRTRKANRNVVSAVGYLDPVTKIWTELVAINTIPYGAAYPLQAEMIAICEAFRIACELSDHIDRLMIFSDCQSVLTGIRKQSRFECLSDLVMLKTLFRHANELYDLGVIAELHWVPAHSGVEGNEKVDRVARRVRKHVASYLKKWKLSRVFRNVAVNPASKEWFLEVMHRAHLR